MCGLLTRPAPIRSRRPRLPLRPIRSRRPSLPLRKGGAARSMARHFSAQPSPARLPTRLAGKTGRFLCKQGCRPREMGPALRPTPLSPACGPRRALYAWRLQYCPKAASLSPGARAGAGSAGHRAIARTSPELPCGTVTGSHPSLPRAVRLRPKTRLHHRHGLRKSGLVDFAPSRLHGLEKVCTLANLGAFRPSLYRAAFRRRIEAVPKSLLRRRPFSLCLGRANPRIDKRKMPALPDSGNGRTRHLSTPAGNASGQEWISQRPAANRRNFPLQCCVGGPQAPPRRSRWASRRRRRALSLMKPAASCWS